MNEVSFLDAIRTESDDYLRRYMRRKAGDSVSIMHRNAVRLEMERRRKR